MFLFLTIFFSPINLCPPFFIVKKVGHLKNIKLRFTKLLNKLNLYYQDKLPRSESCQGFIFESLKKIKFRQHKEDLKDLSYQEAEF